MTERRFACSRCGMCCNRPPELELGEAASLADVFVLQLMMRIYSLPRGVADYVSELPREAASAEYFETRRLLNTFAAASWQVRAKRQGRTLDYVQYLSLSVLPLDLGMGRCPSLNDGLCLIYERRPLSCRSVPLHYSRPEAALVRDLDAFVATPGFRCVTDGDAPVILDAAGVVDREIVTARGRSLEVAEKDRDWKAAMVRAMRGQRHGLPQPRAVEANAQQGALVTTMTPAWLVAEEAGIVSREETISLTQAQLRGIERELAGPSLTPQGFSALRTLQAAYAAPLPPAPTG